MFDTEIKISRFIKIYILYDIYYSNIRQRKYRDIKIKDDAKKKSAIDFDN
jgi:hypothetical protein